MASLPIRRGYGLISTFSLTLMCLAITLHPSHGRAAGGDLEAAVQHSTARLRRSWSSDQVTASLPFPTVDLLPPGQTATKLCGSLGEANDPERPAIWCESGSRVLVDGALLMGLYETDRERRWAIPYWIGTALGESLVSTSPGAETLAPSVANLRANCLAAVLIGAAPGMKLPDQPHELLAPPLWAYGSPDAAQMGTRTQRAYAFLTGFGATHASCSNAEMAALATNQVPTSDSALMKIIPEIQRERARTSLLEVLRSHCIERAGQPCPRPMPKRQQPSSKKTTRNRPDKSQ